MAKSFAEMKASPMWRRWAGRVAAAAIITLAISTLPTLLGLTDDRAARLREQLRQTEEEIARTRATNERLFDQVRALTTDVSAIEAHARDELGMVYPGDVVLRIDPSPLPSNALASSAAGASTVPASSSRTESAAPATGTAAGTGGTR